ncbi:MAG: response regulator [Firmicutes bacterium]|nr:response regulator [Bacillota bacterium]
MKILVAEDDFSSQILMEELLLPFGQVKIAGNGIEAVDAFKNYHSAKTPFDIVFLDIMMPRMDGYDTLAQIRKIEKDALIPFEDRVVVVMLTTLHSQDSITKSVYEGCDWYIPKPIRKETLYGVLEKIAKSEENKDIFGEIKKILYNSNA